jgi:hypothetical protein
LPCFEAAVRPDRFAAVFDLVLVRKGSIGCGRRLRPTIAAPQTAKAGGASTSLTARHDTDSNARFQPQSQSFLSMLLGSYALVRRSVLRRDRGGPHFPPAIIS